DERVFGRLLPANFLGGSGHDLAAGQLPHVRAHPCGPAQAHQHLTALHGQPRNNSNQLAHGFLTIAGGHLTSTFDLYFSSSRSSDFTFSGCRSAMSVHSTAPNAPAAFPCTHAMRFMITTPIEIAKTARRTRTRLRSSRSKCSCRFCTGVISSFLGAARRAQQVSQLQTSSGFSGPTITFWSIAWTDALWGLAQRHLCRRRARATQIWLDPKARIPEPLDALRAVFFGTAAAPALP